MKKSLRRSMTVLHTWAGLLLGWLAFAMFTTGTAAYFQHEITRWMEPEVAAQAVSPLDAADLAVSYLKKQAPDAASWTVQLPDHRRVRTEVSWRSGERGTPRETRLLDAAGREMNARRTRGGYFFYRFHFDLHYLPVVWARYLVGIAAMLMLVAILSGVISHKKLFARFFTLSLKRGFSFWYDAHNMAAVFALPFFLMITYTGLITLANQYMPFGALANFEDRGTFFAETFPRPRPIEPLGKAAALVPIVPVLERAQAIWHGARLESFEIRNPGDANAVIHVRRSRSATVGTRAPSLSFHGVGGERIGETSRQGVVLATESALVGIHAGRFASLGLRWLYFLSGLMGMAMVGTGLVQWTSRRQKSVARTARPHFGFWLVERLNIAAIVGLGAALPGYFLANRLLPLDLPDRAEWEVHCLFMVWGSVTFWAFLRPARRAWPEALAVAAVLYASVPVINGLSTQRGLWPSLMAGDWVYVSIDSAMLLTALAFAGSARAAARSPAKAARRSRSEQPVVAQETGG